MRYAIFASTDPSAKAIQIMSGSLNQILINVPTGGTYKLVGSGIDTTNCPTLGQFS